MGLTRLGPLTVYRVDGAPDPAGIVYGFSTRWSREDSRRKPFDLRRGRARSHANRTALCDRLGLRDRVVVTAQQVHGAAVAVIDERALADTGGARALDQEGVDALITNRRDVALLMFYADCVPILLWDEAVGAVGLLHAGWRGSVAQVAAHTVEAMRDSLGCEPALLRAIIGPAICGGCYRVGEDVAMAVQANLRRGRQALQRDAAGWLLDLKEANRQELQEAGLREEHIWVSDLCTACRSDLFFSHRKEGEPAGRHAAVIALGRRNG